MEIKGDFLGFKFNGYHSTELGITRVSGGDRYNETLYPEIKDKIVEVPGLDGSYYYGSDYGPMQFEIDIAFDHLTEQQFRDLRTTFGTKETKQLIFDERPYKYYMAKLASPIELSYVCFDERKRIPGSSSNTGVRVVDRQYELQSIYNTEEISLESAAFQGHFPEAGEYTFILIDDTYTYNGEPIDNLESYGISIVQEEPILESFVINNIEVLSGITRESITPWEYVVDEENNYIYERIYKGEGKISFICYFPFAKSNFKALPEEGQIYYEGSEDWASSSGLLSAEEYSTVDTFMTINDNNKGFRVYNPGDMSVGFRLYCSFSAATSLSIKYYQDSNANGNNYDAILNIATIEPKPGDQGIIIDTNTGLIYGVPQDPETISKNTTQIQTSSNIYNYYVASGSFFKIEPHKTNINRSKILLSKIGTNNNTITTGNVQIFYDYLYF